MKTGKEYIESLQAMKPEVYAFGETVGNLFEHPCFRPPINALALTYDLAKEHSDLMTADSPFTEGRINRFLHICLSPEDLVKRARIMAGVKQG